MRIFLSSNSKSLIDQLDIFKDLCRGDDPIFFLKALLDMPLKGAQSAKSGTSSSLTLRRMSSIKKIIG